MRRQIPGQLRLFTATDSWRTSTQALTGDEYREALRDSARRRRASANPRVSADPLRDLLAARRWRPGWASELADHLHAEAGRRTTTPLAWRRWLERIIAGQPTVTLDNADRLCLALGQHLDTVYRVS